MSLESADKVLELATVCKEQQKGILGKLTNLKFEIVVNVGKEQEYDLRGLIAGLGAQLSDILNLVNNKAKFAASLTPDERESIATSLTNINNCLSQTTTIITNFIDNNYTVSTTKKLSYLDASGTEHLLPITDLYIHIDQLKPLLRSLHLRKDPDRLKDIEADLESLHVNVTYSESLFEEIKGIKNSIVEQQEDINKTSLLLGEKQQSCDELIIELNSKIAELTKLQVTTVNLHTQSSATHDDIVKVSTLVNDVKQKIMSHEVTVDKFVDKLIERENQLKIQQTESINFSNKLSEFELAQGDLVDKASKIIKEAREALNLSGSVALGSHFNNQYVKSQENLDTWLTRAVLFLIMALAIGMWVLFDASKALNISVVIARISLMPLAIAGSWFCAKQYVNQKRIIEDYAYKKVLAHSIISFKEELQSAEIADHVKAYLEKTLAEIHRYPLETKSSKEQEKFGNDIMKLIKDALPEIIKSSIKVGP